jgi:class 3 adenylate cyclase/tetratricopeptide (TPR) repeat protein
MAETRKTVTVLFADVVGSTALGEALDPETVRRVMERFSAEARSAIESHGGTVEKFIGDAVMAVFGVPAVHEDDALRAVRAASEMRERLAALHAALVRERGIALAVRTGVNTGEVVADDVGNAEFYATGDAVNVAARLEQAAAPGEILLGEHTYRLVRDVVQAEAVESLVVKGKAMPVRAYRLGLIEEPPAVVHHFESPFIGRGEELARLQKTFERAVTERLALLVTILGPAGIGKSRLAAELTSALTDRATVLQGRCLSYGEGITFWPLREILRGLSKRPAGLPDPEQMRSSEETFWAYRKLFERLAAEHPLVLLVEDVHWAEPTLLDLLEHVVEWTRDVPILVLCNARPELLDERPGWPGERVELEPLVEEAVEALVSALTDDLPSTDRTRITEAADGNPLFAEQMVALALEEDGREPEVPATIQSLLAARIDRLEEDERAVLERAAIVGKEFWRGALLALSPRGTEVSTLLQRLVRKRLVRPERSSFPGEDAFRFAHVLIREACYSAMPKGRRAELHERFADWLEQSASPSKEIAGYHLEQAYRYRIELAPTRDVERRLGSRAATTLAHAGFDAHQRGDFAGAVNLLSRSLDVLPADDPARAEFSVWLADSLINADEWRAAAAASEAALAAAERRDDRALAWEARLLRNAVENVLSPGTRSFGESLREAERAAAELEEVGHTRSLARAWTLVAIHRIQLGRFVAAAEAAEQAAALATEARDWHLERASLGWIGLSLHAGPTPASEGIRRIEQIRSRTDDLNLRRTMSNLLSSLYAMLGDEDEARRLRKLVLAEARDLGLKRSIAFAEQPRTRSVAAMLEPAEAEGSLLRSLAYWEETGNEGARSSAAAMLAHLLCAQGRYDEADRYAALGQRAAALDDYEAQSVALAARARVQAHRGDLERAEALGREAVAIVDLTDDIDTRGWLRTDLAEVLSLADRTEEACSVLEDAIRFAKQKEDLTLVERGRARLAAMQTADSRH